MTPPVDAAEFDAHKDPASIIVQFLCRNRDKGYSAKEIAQATGLGEGDVNSALVKMSFNDLMLAVTGRKNPVKIQDATISGVVYFRCVTINEPEHKKIKVD